MTLSTNVIRHFFTIGLISLYFISSQPLPISADSSVDPTKVSVENQFPEGITFHVSPSQSEDIRRITVRFQVLGEQLKRYDNFPTQEDSSIALTYKIRTDTANRYIPPGSSIEFFIEIEKGSGELIYTKPQSFTLIDPRYNWLTISSPRVSIYFYGATLESTKKALKEVEHTIKTIGELLQIDDPEHLTLTVYNNFSHMKEALPPRSTIQEEQLIVEGIFFRNSNVILILGGQRDTSIVTSHETVHFLIDQALGPMTSTIPAWLNEGLAEFASLEAKPSPQASLDEAIRNNQLLPLTSLNSPPGDPTKVILFYEESRSVVQFLLERYGVQSFQLLFQNLKKGQAIDPALTSAYGLNRITLENKWRESIGAPVLSFTDRPNPIPSPSPWPTITPFGSETLRQPMSPLPPSKERELTSSSSSDYSCNRGNGIMSIESMLLFTVFFRGKRLISVANTDITKIILKYSQN